MKTAVQSIKSAQMRLTGSVDEYLITADITKKEYTSNILSDGKNGNLQNGLVTKDGKQVAVFRSSDAENLDVTYFVKDSDVRATILTIIEDFIASSRVFINNSIINITEKV